MEKTIKLTDTILEQKINQILFERVGVPNNITETATIIYHGILWYFPEKYDLTNTRSVYEITINGDFVVSDYRFNKINVSITVQSAQGIYVPELWGAEVFAGSIDIKGDKFHRNVGKTMNINIKIGVGKVRFLASILEMIKTEKASFISVISHELLHQYENYKKPSNPISSAVKYKSVQEYSIERINPINEFMFLLYFTHEIESDTRSPELYGMMKSSGVTRSNFKEFFNTDNYVMGTLRRCRDYTFSGLVSSLYDYMDEIDNFLLSLDQKNVSTLLHVNGTDKEKIHDILSLTHIAVFNLQVEKYRNIMTQSLNNFLKMINQKGYDRDVEEKQKYFTRFLKSLDKNYMKFFENEIKRINFVGDKTIKKLSKLYSMLDDEKSIVNWELHNKINKTGEKTKLKLQELLNNGITPDKNLIPKKKKK